MQLGEGLYALDQIGCCFLIHRERKAGLSSQHIKAKINILMVCVFFIEGQSLFFCLLRSKISKS